MTGIERIARAFGPRASGPRASASGSSGIMIMAHAVCGYPDAPTSARMLEAMAASGADLIEAQLPFSDPSADGPSIVEANHASLRSGSRTAACLSSLEALRERTEAPILVMSYLNPLMAYGIDALVERMARGGLDGLIVPDYPDDEGELELAEKCAAAGLALVPLIAPTTSLERAAALSRLSASPFLYVVLRLGVTGRKTELDGATIERLAALKRHSGKYIAAGFGLRDREQIRALKGSADCAIVGSALVDAARRASEEGRDPAEAVGELLSSIALKTAQR